MAMQIPLPIWYANLYQPGKVELSFYQPAYELPSASWYNLPTDRSVPAGKFQSTNNIL